MTTMLVPNPSYWTQRDKLDHEGPVLTETCTSCNGSGLGEYGFVDRDDGNEGLEGSFERTTCSLCSGHKIIPQGFDISHARAYSLGLRWLRKSLSSTLGEVAR